MHECEDFEKRNTNVETEIIGISIHYYIFV